MKKNKVKKSSAAEYELRVHTVYEMIIKGATRPFIVRYASKEWNVSSRQVDTYMAEAKKIIDDIFDKKSKEKIINKHRAMLADLYVKNYTIQDFRECRSILESERRLLGLDAPKKIESKKEVSKIKPIEITVRRNDKD